MLSKRLFIALVVFGLAACDESRVFAAGGGARGSRVGGGSATTCRPRPGNPLPYARSQNVVVVAPWVYGNGYWGWGGLGWGCEYPGWAYQLAGVPYFAQFPPVNYGYGENQPVLNTTIPRSWAGNESSQPAPASTAAASPPRPPLRIRNPFYVEEQADNR